MPLPRQITLLAAAVAACCWPGAARAEELPPPAERIVEFQRDVLPIFKTSCWSCHGEKRQEGGYRLDVNKIALTGGENHAPNIVPGKSADSPLIQFVAGQIEGMRMPAKGKPLSRAQIALLRAWIDQGANWPDEASAGVRDSPDWWSLKPLELPTVPLVPEGASNPVDAFIRAELSRRGLVPAPPADRRTLIRRVYFDLVGLPPTPEEADAFISDLRGDAYERMVDRLLASPRYGERWARHWMDAAHFAETHGHDQDRVREHAWPYRDYLIASLNDDKPYGRFIQEQVAADALFPDQPQLIPALGFLAAGPWDESSLRDIREDTLDRQIGRYLDRDDMLSTVMNNVVSMTVQCARCHDHKFDPISQDDYYALQAVFSGVERANRTFDADSSVQQRRAALRARMKRLEKLDDDLRSELLSAEVQREVAEFERESEGRVIEWKPARVERAVATEGSTLSAMEDGSWLSSGARPERDTYAFTLRVPAGAWTGFRLEVLTHDNLPKRGPGRQDNGNLHLTEFEVFLGNPAGKRLSILRAASDFDQDGWDVARAIDGNLQSAWGIFPKVGKPHEAVFELREKLVLAEETTVTVVLKQLHGGGHLIGRPRLSLTQTPSPARSGTLPSEIAAILAVPAAQRTAEQQLTLALFQQREKCALELGALPKPRLVYAAANDFDPDGGLKPPPGPRPIHVLRRGDIRKPLVEAQAGALACVTGLPARFELGEFRQNESARRAALARWLTHPDNPLTWRSIVNRVWHHHFGRGLVATPNDFGRMGAEPSHPDLLDWLAMQFRDGGQSLKALHRLIVTSATYRQSTRPSAARPGTADGSQVDSDNRLLWRMNRMRLDAECVRDAVLAISGRLDNRMGGPSDRQFDLQPGRHVTPIVDYAKFDVDSSAGRRRSVYRFLFRTLPDPFMEALDCPAGDQMTPVRANTVTVQQALAMWNDAFMIRHCEHFAARLATLESELPGRIRAAFRLALVRYPTEEELREFTAYAQQHGLENLCRLLLNSNEFVFVD